MSRPCKLRLSLAAIACMLLGASSAIAEDAPAPKPSYPPISTVEFRVGKFQVALREDTQTLAALCPVEDANFSFVPTGREPERQEDGYNHIGDINIRLRQGSGGWQDYASAHQRKPVRTLRARGALAAADITASMGAGIPVTVQRSWIDDRGVLTLRFTLKNTSTAPVEIGGLGMPMVFDNIITDRSLEQAHAQASFVDPYIGQDAGYLQVTRLSGQAPALLVLPEAQTPLEAYRPILHVSEAPEGDVFTDRSQRRQTFEGFYDWTVASKGFAEKEWAAAPEQWNTPTGFTLSPGQSRTFGLRFVLSPSIRAIEQTLVAQRRPVAVGIPGYVVPMDLDASLFINSPTKIREVRSEPEGALSISAVEGVKGWRRYSVRGKQWGRARLSITYDGGEVQTVSYYVTKPLDQVVGDLGGFATTKQWFDDPADPFKRAPAILTYDREAERIVTQEPRVWIAGMSDEGGGGSWVAAMIKQLDNPRREEVAKLERLMNESVVGKLQVAEGPQAGAVRKSLFYYDPAAFPGYYDTRKAWSSWASWNKQGADDLGRSYNYPHVAIGHWVLYRLARNREGLVRARDWRWYLDHAYQTIVAMVRDAPEYAEFGQMEGSVFIDILNDLEREGLAEQAQEVRRLMQARADHWRTLAYPFGSEMAWDSTGQTEVYDWMRFFGHEKEAKRTLDAIEGYDPTIPHWGYNGNARRYWDFLYGGKTARIERQIHHYGSTLNALPLFDAYRADPSDLYPLRVAYGGLLGGITNIDQDGFGSAAFHAWPDKLDWDPYTGDYGMGFFGFAYGAATYLVNDATFGWLGFGGNVEKSGGAIRIKPKDSARTRLFIAPARVWITLETGKIATAEYQPVTGNITLTLDAADDFTKVARVLVTNTAGSSRRYAITAGATERGARAIPLSTQPTPVDLSPR